MFVAPLCVTECVGAYQVLVGEPGDLVLQAGFDPGLGRQLQVLGQQLLLPVVLLLHVLQLAAQRLHLAVVRPPLGLQLLLQQPGEKQNHVRKKNKTNEGRCIRARRCRPAAAACCAEIQTSTQEL